MDKWGMVSFFGRDWLRGIHRKEAEALRVGGGVVVGDWSYGAYLSYFYAGRTVADSCAFYVDGRRRGKKGFLAKGGVCISFSV